MKPTSVVQQRHHSLTPRSKSQQDHVLGSRHPGVGSQIRQQLYFDSVAAETHSMMLSHRYLMSMTYDLGAFFCT
jgi:hypothetical protein